jgi:hypothetical protein
MTLLGRGGGRPQDSSVEMTVRARAVDGSEHQFRFKPEGDGRTRLQQVALTGARLEMQCPLPNPGF